MAVESGRVDTGTSQVLSIDVETLVLLVPVFLFWENRTWGEENPRVMLLHGPFLSELQYQGHVILGGMKKKVIGINMQCLSVKVLGYMNMFWGTENVGPVCAFWLHIHDLWKTGWYLYLCQGSALGYTSGRGLSVSFFLWLYWQRDSCLLLQHKTRLLLFSREVVSLSCSPMLLLSNRMLPRKPSCKLLLFFNPTIPHMLRDMKLVPGQTVLSCRQDILSFHWIANSKQKSALWHLHIVWVGWSAEIHLARMHRYSQFLIFMNIYALTMRSCTP